jgi:hypothetical protein
VSIEMLVGMVTFLIACVVLFEATAYWHVHNVFEEAASEGLRRAAAFDGSCRDGVSATQRYVAAHAGGWSSGVQVRCVDAASGGLVTVEVTARSVGVGGTGFGVRVVQSLVKEG